MGIASLLAEVRISDGICFYQFPHTLRLKLHNPRIYAKLNLRLQNGSRAGMPSFCGKSVSTISIRNATKAKRRSSH